jgi:hypothetical protein
LTAVLADRASAGLRVQPALSNEELTAFRQTIIQRLNYELPAPYTDILSQTDGLDSNGIVLYASRQYFQGDKFLLQGFLEANLLLRVYAPNLDFIYFAESGMDLYRHNLQSNQFEVCTRIGLRAMETFATAAEFFKQILDDMLDSVDEENEDNT